MNIDVDADEEREDDRQGYVESLEQTPRDTDWYQEDMETLSKAMLEARRAFDKYLNEERNIDGAYFELELTGHLLDVEFDRFKKIDMQFHPDEDGDSNE